MDDRKREVERIEQGNAWHDSDEVVDIDVGPSLDKIVPVRLPTDLWEELRREARELGIGPSTLVRMWMLEKLRQIRRAPAGVTRVRGVDERMRRHVADPA